MNTTRYYAASLALASALLAGPGSASAQTYQYYNVCSVGQFKACASAEVTWSAPTQSLTMRVWNMSLSGKDGAPLNVNDYNQASEFGGWHTLTAVGIKNMQYTKATGATVTSVATYVDNYGATRVLTKWGTDVTANSIQISDQTDLGADVDGGGHKQGIVGCYDPNPNWAAANKHVMTCNSYPNNAYVEFSFSGLQSVDVSGSIFAWHGQQVGIDTELSLKGEHVYVPPQEPPTVVPEPVTSILLGSGLMGLAAARRRKKKAEEAASNVI